MKQINFKKKINWWKINFDLKSVNYIKNSIKQKNVSQGLVTKKLENKFSKVLKIKYVTMTNNGSVALLMSLLSLNLKKDEEVILQNITWISSANAIYFAVASEDNPWEFNGVYLVPNLNVEVDCLNILGGSAYIDMCGSCDSDPLNDCEQDCNGIWGGDSEEDIYKILKRKHKINKEDVEWIKQETPPFA